MSLSYLGAVPGLCVEQILIVLRNFFHPKA
jgi:hypothetical protein